MGVHEFFRGLGLKNDLIPNYKIRVKSVWQNDAFISHFIPLLSAKRNLCTIQFDDKGVFVNDFIVSFAKFTVNFHTKTNELENFFFVKQFAH